VIDDLSAGLAARLPDHERLGFIVGDMTDGAAWARVWRSDEPITRVLHLAGHVGVRRVLADPEGCARSHHAMAQTLVASLLELDPTSRPGLIAASSSEVYRASRDPLTEQSPVWKRSDPGWGAGRWAYAASKLSAEQAFDNAQLQVLHLRLFNVVGAGQNAESGMVLPRFVEAARLGEPLQVFGDGSQVRTLGHVACVAEDLAELCLRADMPVGVLNLGGTATTRIEDLAQTVLQVAQCDGELLEYVDPALEWGEPFAEVYHRIPSLDRARTLGLVRRPWSLIEIVRDAWTRHGVPSPG
jgi:UDP-glucose 4-epimerase